MNLCDIMSSFPSVGSHSFSNSLAKRPLEQVGNFAVEQKTQSMGFRESANFRNVAGFNRMSSMQGKNLYSPPNDNALKTVAAAKKGESRQF